VQQVREVSTLASQVDQVAALDVEVEMLEQTQVQVVEELIQLIAAETLWVVETWVV
jgi:hypothetical protein